MATPKRIVSLVPSMTETLFALGYGERVVGVTRFCVHPAEARERTRVVGGTKNPRIEAVLALSPDLVVANQEENRREDVETLRKSVPVRVFFPGNLPEAVADIRALGDLVGEPGSAAAIANEIERARDALRRVKPDPIRYLYLIWRRPYMVAGPQTFIEAFLAEAGFVNTAPFGRGRYAEMTGDEIERSDADVFLLASEPFPFGEKHRAELGDRAILVDGELLSWHGARLREGVPYARSLAERISTSKSLSARRFPGPSP